DLNNGGLCLSPTSAYCMGKWWAGRYVSVWQPSPGPNPLGVTMAGDRGFTNLNILHHLPFQPLVKYISPNAPEGNKDVFNNDLLNQPWLQQVVAAMLRLPNAGRPELERKVLMLVGVETLGLLPAWVVPEGVALDGKGGVVMRS
ncbi:hypothetical protein FRC10_007282, partial [Ceratobasidium sp. 414]